MFLRGRMFVRDNGTVVFSRCIFGGRCYNFVRFGAFTTTGSRRRRSRSRRLTKGIRLLFWEWGTGRVEGECAPLNAWECRARVLIFYRDVYNDPNCFRNRKKSNVLTITCGWTLGDYLRFKKTSQLSRSLSATLMLDNWFQFGHLPNSKLTDWGIINTFNAVKFTGF